MSRTHLAAAGSAVVVAAALTGLGMFLGFPATPVAWVGIVAGLLAGLLVLGAGRRAETFHPPQANAHLVDHPDDHPDDHLDVVDRDEQHAADDRADDPPAGDARGR